MIFILKVHTSTIERPNPNGNLYFIRSHDFTPVTRTVYSDHKEQLNAFEYTNIIFTRSS